MPRQRRRIVLTTVVICFALIAVPFVLTWQQTHMERLNRQLIAAIRRLDADAVTEALKQGADPNTRGNPDAPSVFVQWIQEWFRRDNTAQSEADTALNEAISAGKTPDGSSPGDAGAAQTRIIQALLQAGADTNPHYRIGKPPILADPPLAAASRYCPLEVVRLLLFHKADVNAPTYSGNTALIEATLYKHSDIVQLLLQQKGVKVDAGDSNKMTALMCAAKQDTVEIEEVLLKYHADVKIKSALGWTALKYAQMNGNTRSVQLLKKNGATE